MTTFKPGDRVQWLGFIEPNPGEPSRPIGTLGTVRNIFADIPTVAWDGEYEDGSTWVANIALAPTPEPVDPDTQALRERLLDKAIKAADFSADADTVVNIAKAFEAYITGDTK